MKEFLFILRYIVLYFVSYFCFALFISTSGELFYYYSGISFPLFSFMNWFPHLLLGIFLLLLRKKYKNGKIDKSLFIITFLTLFIIFVPIFNKKCGQTNFTGGGFIDSKKTTLVRTIIDINKECKEMLFY